jgi:hypothetical protein
MWLSFHLIGLVWVWFSQMFVVGSEAWLCVDPLSVLWCLNRVLTQFLWGCVSTLDHVVVCQHSICSPFNELIFGLEILELTHLVTRLLK